MDKGSGVLRQHAAVSQTRVSEHPWLPRKHPHTHNAKWQSVFCLQQTNLKNKVMHVCFHAPGRGHSAQLLGTWRSVILDTSWLFRGAERWPVGLARLPLFGLDDWKRLRKNKNGKKSLIDNSIHDLHPNMQCGSVMLTNNYCMLSILFGVTCCHGGFQRKKQTLKKDSVWQLRVSFHRALWRCVVLWLVCVTNQILVASLLLPAQWVQQSGPEFTASREKQTSLSLKSSWKTPSVRFWSPVSSLLLNVTKNKIWTCRKRLNYPSQCIISFTFLHVCWITFGRKPCWLNKDHAFVSAVSSTFLLSCSSQESQG